MSLRELYSHASWRRFRAKSRDGRCVEILGFGPTGEAMIGWREGEISPSYFDPDESKWEMNTIYV